MQTQRLLQQWVVPLLIPLVIIGTAFIGTLPITQADSTETCTLYDITSHIGTTPVDTSQLSNPSQALQTDVSNYNLGCPNNDTICHLTTNTGNATLSLTAVQSAGLTTTIGADFSPGGTPYNLNCEGGTNSNPSNSSSSSSTSCTGNTNANASDSSCNSNTPDPSAGSCQVAWTQGGGGSVTLDPSQVTDDSNHPGLKEALAGYNLKCASDVNVSSCQLVPGANDSGSPKLDLANVMNRSPWIYSGLNGKYGLNCSGSGSSSSANSTNSTQVSQTEFGTILKGFCQIFAANLKNGSQTGLNRKGLTNRELRSITNGTKTVKDVLENSSHGLNDSDVESFEKSQISIANTDFSSNSGTYAPDACQQSGQNLATDSTNFQSYFNSSDYQNLDASTIDQLFTAAVIPAGSANSQRGLNRPGAGGYFYIRSKLDSNRVLDIQNAKRGTNVPTTGIPTLAFPQNQGPNQLWKFVPDGQSDGYSFIQSQVGFVLDIQGANTAAGTPVVAFTKNTSDRDNQLWKFVADSAHDGYGHIQSKNGLVLDIPNSNSQSQYNPHRFYANNPRRS